MAAPAGSWGDDDDGGGGEYARQGGEEAEVAHEGGEERAHKRHRSGDGDASPEGAWPPEPRRADTRNFGFAPLAPPPQARLGA
jgi:hypothetical protein